jgi:hypothetical protein
MGSMSRRPAALILALALLVSGCGLAVRSDRSSIGGGPEQATAQAQARIRATMSAFAAQNPSLTNGQPCDCESK